MQETTFPVEILVHDDASSDGTADVIREYEQRFRGLFHVIYQKENQYSKGVNVSNLNFQRARGQYIAICDGDDYWTDPLKLEKQVSLLDSHPDIAACFAGFLREEVVTGASALEIFDIDDESVEGIAGFCFTLEDMCKGWLTKTLTAMVRADLLIEIDIASYRHYRDIHMFYHAIRGRKAFYFREAHGVFRVHPGGVNSMKQGKVNANAAYNCYRELFLNNRDQFTRRMCFLATASLLNYNLFNAYQGNNFLLNLRLLGEAIRLCSSISELRVVFNSFIKREVKDYIKKMSPY